MLDGTYESMNLNEHTLEQIIESGSKIIDGLRRRFYNG